MEKQIIPSDTGPDARLLQFSLAKPITSYYNGICKPIFLIPQCSYTLDATRQYASIRLSPGSSSAKAIEFDKFLSNLDQIVPVTAWQQRHKWFPEDLHENTQEEFNEAYRRNLQPNKQGFITFNVYLGELRDGNDLPVPSFKITKGGSTVPLTHSLQELAWGSTQGRVSVLVECSGLWTKEESFGLGWKIRQIVYKSQPCLPKGSVSFTDNESIQNHIWNPPSAPDSMVGSGDGVTTSAVASIPAVVPAAATIGQGVKHSNPLLDQDDDDDE